MLNLTSSRRLLQANQQPLIGFVHKYRQLSHTLAPRSASNRTNLYPSSILISRAQQVARHLSSTADKKLEMSALPISDKGYNANAPSQYAVRKNGAANTPEYRIYIEKDGVVVSPFHDIPLYANEQQTVLNMIVEIPRWTNAKMEVPFPPPALIVHLGTMVLSLSDS
jgi:hypothetical protein